MNAGKVSAGKVIQCADCVFISIPDERALMGRCWKKGMDVEVWCNRRCEHFSLSPFAAIRHELHKQPEQGVHP